MRTGRVFIAAFVVFAVGLLGSLLFFQFGKQETPPLEPEMPDSASVSTQQESITTPETGQPVRILFGGDMMFDRYIRETAIKRDNAFVFGDDARTLMRGVDLVVANLEGPITDYPSKSTGSEIGEARNYYFTFDPSWTETLYDVNIRVVNIGNNHILNFGEEGLRQTRRYFEAGRIGYFGDPFEVEKRWLIQDIHGMKIAFVNYNQFVADGEKKVFEDIATVHPQADIVIVYAHWGVEYAPVSNRQKELAHQFVDAGTDVVIGSHPHVVQEREVYKGKTIYYSLGNFIFDQYFHSDTKEGLLVEMTIDPESKQLSFRDIPTTLKSNGQTILRH